MHFAWKGHLQSDTYCVRWDVKHLTQYMSLWRWPFQAKCMYT